MAVAKEEPGHDCRVKSCCHGGCLGASRSSKEGPDLTRQCGQASWRRGPSKLRSTGKVGVNLGKGVGNYASMREQNVPRP